jgi:hypothetical protein
MNRYDYINLIGLITELWPYVIALLTGGGLTFVGLRTVGVGKRKTAEKAAVEWEVLPFEFNSMDADLPLPPKPPSVNRFSPALEKSKRWLNRKS